jgi:dihydroorotate dehydrogenase (NAD+) catalytic subunit
MNPDLSIEFAGIKFKNPVFTASGTFGYGYELSDLIPLERL